MQHIGNMKVINVLGSAFCISENYNGEFWGDTESNSSISNPYCSSYWTYMHLSAITHIGKNLTIVAILLKSPSEFYNFCI